MRLFCRPSKKGDCSMTFARRRNPDSGQLPVTTLSLTRPAVAKGFSYVPWPNRTHFFVGAPIASVSGAAVHLRSPYDAQALTLIQLVLPTGHLSDPHGPR